MNRYYPDPTPGYFDLKYKLYIPMGLQRYGISAPHKSQGLPYHDNRLVSHILDTIGKRGSPKDPQMESIDELFEDRFDLIRSKMNHIKTPKMWPAEMPHVDLPIPLPEKYINEE